MAFKGKADKGSGSQWYGGDTHSDGSVVYGKSAGDWLYAKQVQAKRNGYWYRAWTDCRQHDATGGRDWTPAPGVTEYQLSCNNRQSRVRTDYSKPGCTSYSRYTDWVSSPDCNSSCFTTSTYLYYTGTCLARTRTERTTYTANDGSGCTTYFTDAAPIPNPTCGGNPPGDCWTNVTCNYVGQTGVTFAEIVFDNVFDFGGTCIATIDADPYYWYIFYTCGTTESLDILYLG